MNYIITITRGTKEPTKKPELLEIKPRKRTKRDEDEGADLFMNRTSNLPTAILPQSALPLYENQKNDDPYLFIGKYERFSNN